MSPDLSGSALYSEAEKSRGMVTVAEGFWPCVCCATCDSLGQHEPRSAPWNRWNSESLWPASRSWLWWNLGGKFSLSLNGDEGLVSVMYEHIFARQRTHFYSVHFAALGHSNTFWFPLHECLGTFENFPNTGFWIPFCHSSYVLLDFLRVTHTPSVFTNTYHLEYSKNNPFHIFIYFAVSSRSIKENRYEFQLLFADMLHFWFHWGI